MDLSAPVRAFDRFQRRHRPLAFMIAVLRNFSEQGAGNASVLIAYWGFFSIFPLLLLFTTVLGFVMQGDPGLAHSLIRSAAARIPIIGGGLRSLHGSGPAVAISVGVTLWSGLAVTVAAQNAFNRVYAIPHSQQPDFFMSRLRGLRFLLAAGFLQMVSTLVSGLVSGGLAGGWLVAAGIVLSLALNLVLFFVAFRFLTAAAVPRRELWPGIILAAVGWEVLQVVGGIYVGHVVRNANHTYGTFATVIGLLAWLYLGARIVTFAAETNVVLTRRLWPRSLMDPPEPADRRARVLLAKMEERDDRETVEVAFHPPEARGEPDPGRPPYAVAPAPVPGEPARAQSVRTAIPDLHTLTVAQVLEATTTCLDEVPASLRGRQQARKWIQATQAALRDELGELNVEREAMHALALAVQRALGLSSSP